MFLPVKSVNDMVRSLLTIAGLSEGGSEIINTTDLNENNYVSIVFLEDTTFTLLEGNHTGWEGTTYPTGLVLNGTFKKIQLATGSIIAYKEII